MIFEPTTPQPEPFDPLPVVIKITVAIMFICLAFMLATGCTTPPQPVEPVWSGMIRPDGTAVPAPGYETNVVPWVYTNRAGER